MDSARSSYSIESSSVGAITPRDGSTPSLGNRDSRSFTCSTPSPREQETRSSDLLSLLAMAAERRSVECKLCWCRVVRVACAPLFVALGFGGARAPFDCADVDKTLIAWRAAVSCLVKNDSPRRVLDTSSRLSAPAAPAVHRAPGGALGAASSSSFVAYSPEARQRHAKKRTSEDMEISTTDVSCAWCGKTKTPQWRSVCVCVVCVVCCVCARRVFVVRNF
jgi:hypothetical protein